MNRFLWLLAAVLIVILVWTGGWFFAASYIRGEIIKLAEAEPPVSCERLDVGGYPFRFDVTCAGFILTDQDITIAVPELKATALVYRPTHIQAFFTGPATYTDAFYGSERRLAWQEARASLRLDGFKLVRLSLIADELQLTDTLFGDALVASASHGEFHIIDMPDMAQPDRGLMTAGLFLRADNLAMPGTEVSQGALQIEANIKNLPQDIRLWGAPDLLPYWQQQEGRIELIRADYSDTRASLNADGTLSLSDAGELEGTLDIASNGIVEQFQHMIPATFRDAVLGNRTPDGTYNQTLTFRRGDIYAGIIPMANVPPLF